VGSLYILHNKNTIGFNSNERMACCDGLYIGIIGPEGECVKCGRGSVVEKGRSHV